MSTPVPPSAALYDTFARYAYAGRNFCEVCYGRDEWREIAGTPLRSLGMDQARKLLWETADHWESADVYRHYLPRLMEVLAPPANVEPLFPRHVSETLLSLGFREWPAGERAAILSYLHSLMPHVTWLRGNDDRQEWMQGLEALGQTSDRPPAAS